MIDLAGRRKKKNRGLPRKLENILLTDSILWSQVLEIICYTTETLMSL